MSFNEDDARRDAIGANAIQVGGTHYKTMQIEPWQIIDTWAKEQQIGAYRAGALKYIMRLGKKDAEAQEARKAEHYCRKLAEVLEQKNG